MKVNFNGFDRSIRVCRSKVDSVEMDERGVRVGLSWDFGGGDALFVLRMIMSAITYL